MLSHLPSLRACFSLFLSFLSFLSLLLSFSLFLPLFFSLFFSLSLSSPFVGAYLRSFSGHFFPLFDEAFALPTVQCPFCLFTKSPITKDGGEGEYLEQAENMVISAINPPPLAICTLCSAGGGLDPAAGSPAAGGEHQPPYQTSGSCFIQRAALGLERAELLLQTADLPLPRLTFLSTRGG